MKKLFITLMICCGAENITAKDGFTTTFDITGMPDTVAFEIRLHDSERGFADSRFDTIQLVNGHGELKDVSAVSYPVQAFAFTPFGCFEFFIANYENERISGSGGDIENLTLEFEGASWSGDLMEFNRKVKAPLMRIHGRMGNWTELTEAGRDSIRSESKAIEESEIQYCLEYPNSWMTLFRTTSMLSNYPREVLEKINEQLTPDRRESTYGEILATYLSTTQISEGDSLMDFDIEAPDQNGQPFKLSEMKEPYIVVDFSQCYCGPCIQAVKEIRELREKYAGKARRGRSASNIMSAAIQLFSSSALTGGLSRHGRAMAPEPSSSCSLTKRKPRNNDNPGIVLMERRKEIPFAAFFYSMDFENSNFIRKFATYK